MPGPRPRQLGVTDLARRTASRGGDRLRVGASGPGQERPPGGPLRRCGRPDEPRHTCGWCWVAEVLSIYSGHDHRSVLVGIQQRTSSVMVDHAVTPCCDTVPTAPVSLSGFARERPLAGSGCLLLSCPFLSRPLSPVSLVGKLSLLACVTDRLAVFAVSAGSSSPPASSTATTPGCRVRIVPQMPATTATITVAGVAAQRGRLAHQVGGSEQGRSELPNVHSPGLNRWPLILKGHERFGHVPSEPSPTLKPGEPGHSRGATMG